MVLVWAGLAGAAAGLAFGYLGAGGAIVTLPFVLYLADMPAHMALGSKAAGVALIATALALWRVARGQADLRAGAALALPGLAGVWAGTRLGLALGGHELVRLLGALLFLVAGWVAWASRGAAMPAGGGAPGAGGPWLPLGLAGLGVGAVAGFFGVAGGFLVVPALMLVAGMDLVQSAATAMVPIAAFAGWIGIQYWLSGDADPAFALAMVLPGVAAGFGGMWLGRHVSRTLSQQVFAGFLVALGVYMVVLR
ncbi:MAG TPA: sulfite exporter TauE/SafE family protein [Gammaproteobacteria bacterium]|nr:sulfite exporter TauE/SafE family protein [Gammaproteobacteria bacterium]